jgi:hypothetical protein
MKSVSLLSDFGSDLITCTNLCFIALIFNGLDLSTKKHETRPKLY